MSFDFFIQALPGNSEKFCGSGFVAFGTLHGFFDQDYFQSFGLLRKGKITFGRLIVIDLLRRIEEIFDWTGVVLIVVAFNLTHVGKEGLFLL